MQATTFDPGQQSKTATADHRSPSISLIIPAWNEEESIATAIAEAKAALEQFAARHEIIVVDDGSTDRTKQVVERTATTTESVRLISFESNCGYGAAIRAGFAAAQMELVAFTDADCQFDLRELDRFILLAQHYDVVCGYRIDRQDSVRRLIYSRIYNLLAQILLGLGVRDIDCALKVFRRDVAKSLNISDNGFLVDTVMLTRARQMGCRIVEVGVSHRPRLLGASKVTASHVPLTLCHLARFWWNEVQFCGEPLLPPGATNASSMHRGSRGGMWLWAQAAVLVFAAVFLLTNLGYPLIDCDETRYAEIPREMIATENWILPQLNFQAYYDKPPLLYWLCACSYSLFGINEAAARLVPALAALATLASTMFFASRNFGPRTGLISGFVLLLSVGYVVTSRFLLMDGVLALFVSTSLFTAYEAIRGPRIKTGWWVLSGVCVGLAFLTKGPLAIVLWLPPVCSMAWLSVGHAQPRWHHYLALFSIAAAIAGPWFAAVLKQDPGFWTEFFLTHNLARFAGGFHPKPIWYFLPVLLVAAHPWSMLLVPYLRFLFNHTLVGRTKRPHVVGFLLLCSGWTFVFFSMSKCKLPTYLLPAAPAMAVMLGHYLNDVLREPVHPARSATASFLLARMTLTATCLAGIAIAAIVMVAAGDFNRLSFIWLAIWIAILSVSAMLMHIRQGTRLAWGLSSAAAVLFSLMLMHQMLPAYSRSQTLYGDSWSLTGTLATKSGLPIATVQHEFSEIPFYLSRDDIFNFPEVDDPALQKFLATNTHCVLFVEHHVPIDDIERQLPPDTRLKRIGERGGAAIFETIPNPMNARIAGGLDAAGGESRR